VQVPDFQMDVTGYWWMNPEARNHHARMLPFVSMTSGCGSGGVKTSFETVALHKCLRRNGGRTVFQHSSDPRLSWSEQAAYNLSVHRFKFEQAHHLKAQTNAVSPQ